MGFEAAAEDDEEAAAVEAAGPAAEEADMAAEAARITEASSIIGSGEDGGEDLSPAVSGAISFLLRNLLSSSRRLLAISAGERGVSLKAEEVDAAAEVEVEGDGEEEDIMGEREFCCRLSIASHLSRPCSLRGTHLRLLEGGGLWLQTAGPTPLGWWTLEGEETLGGSKGCSDRAAYGRFRVTHAISRARLRGPSGGRLGVAGGLFGV